MKQSNRDCKIVRDLLPNYIENLTDEVTNEFINEHIAKCPECEEALKNMNGEIKLEEIHQEKEIKYLKKIRRRVKETIAIVSLIVIVIATGVVGYVYKKSQIQVNNYTFMSASYIKENQEGTIDGNLYCKMIAVFDEEDLCASVRVVEEGYKEDIVKKQYEIKKSFIDSNTNVDRIDDGIYYNTNYWNGVNKEKVEEYWTKYYKINKLEKI